jgi:hypothetical protein
MPQLTDSLLYSKRLINEHDPQALCFNQRHILLTELAQDSSQQEENESQTMNKTIQEISIDQHTEPIECLNMIEDLQETLSKQFQTDLMFFDHHSDHNLIRDYHGDRNHYRMCCFHFKAKGKKYKLMSSYNNTVNSLPSEASDTSETRDDSLAKQANQRHTNKDYRIMRSPSAEGLCLFFVDLSTPPNHITVITCAYHANSTILGDVYKSVAVKNDKLPLRPLHIHTEPSERIQQPMDIICEMNNNFVNNLLHEAQIALFLQSAWNIVTNDEQLQAGDLFYDDESFESIDHPRSFKKYLYPFQYSMKKPSFHPNPSINAVLKFNPRIMALKHIAHYNPSIPLPFLDSFHPLLRLFTESHHFDALKDSLKRAFPTQCCFYRDVCCCSSCQEMKRNNNKGNEEVELYAHYFVIIGPPLSYYAIQIILVDSEEYDYVQRTCVSSIRLLESLLLHDLAHGKSDRSWAIKSQERLIEHIIEVLCSVTMQIIQE